MFEIEANILELKSEFFLSFFLGFKWIYGGYYGVMHNKLLLDCCNVWNRSQYTGTQKWVFFEFFFGFFFGFFLYIWEVYDRWFGITERPAGARLNNTANCMSVVSKTCFDCFTTRSEHLIDYCQFQYIDNFFLLENAKQIKI